MGHSVEKKTIAVCAKGAIVRQKLAFCVIILHNYECYFESKSGTIGGNKSAYNGIDPILAPFIRLGCPM